MRQRARIDANQPAIVKALRDYGCSVLPIHQLGKGAPDLLIGKNGRNLLMEIKDPSQPPSKRCLTPDELTFFHGWGGQICMIETIEQAITAVRRYA